MGQRKGTRNVRAQNSNRIWEDEDLLYLLLSYKKLSVRYKPQVCFDTIGREIGRSIKACASQLSLLRTGKTKISMLSIQTVLEDLSDINFDFTIPDDENESGEFEDPVITAVPTGNYSDLDSAQDYIRGMFGKLNQTIQTLEALNDKLITDNERLHEDLHNKSSRDEDLKTIEGLNWQAARYKSEIDTMEGWLREEQKKTHNLTEENIRLINEIESLKEKLAIVFGIRNELEIETDRPGLKRVK